MSAYNKFVLLYLHKLKKFHDRFKHKNNFDHHLLLISLIKQKVSLEQTFVVQNLSLNNFIVKSAAVVMSAKYITMIGRTKPVYNLYTVDQLYCPTIIDSVEKTCMGFS